MVSLNKALLSLLLNTPPMLKVVGLGDQSRSPWAPIQKIPKNTQKTRKLGILGRMVPVWSLRAPSCY